jgi:hypothetical protein
LRTIPGLTVHLINTHLPYSTATKKGRNVDSLQPAEEICAAHDMFCFAALANLNTGTMYTNLN